MSNIDARGGTARFSAARFGAARFGAARFGAASDADAGAAGAGGRGRAGGGAGASAIREDGELSRVLKLSRSINNDQHAVASACALNTWGQVARNTPVVGLLRSRQPRCDGSIREYTIGTGSVTEHEADCNSVGRVVFRIPGHGEVFALGDSA